MNDWDRIGQLLNAQRATQQPIPQNVAAQPQTQGGGWNPLDGFWKTINQAGQTVVGGLGSLAGVGGDFIDDVFHGNSNDASYRDDFMKWNMGAEDAGDAWAKYGGAALNTVNTALDFIPATAVFTRNPLANALQGAVGGFADELYENGKDFDLGNAGQRALAGAGAGLVTGAAMNGLSGAKGVLGKLGNSNLARSAIGGALGGGTGAGIQTAMNGGSLEDVFSNVMSGAGAGALSGAASGTAMNLGGRMIGGAINKGRNVLDGVTRDIADDLPIAATRINAMDEATSPNLRGGVNQSIKNINAVRNGDVDVATIGKLPVGQMGSADVAPDITYEGRIINNKIMAGNAKNLSVAELAYATNNHTRGQIIEFEKNGTGRLNIIRPLNNGKTAVIALEKQPNGNTLITSIRPDADSNYVRNLQQNKNASVLYDTADGAATASITETGNSAASRATASSNIDNIPNAGDNVNPMRSQPLDYQGNMVEIEQPNMLTRAGKRISQTGEAIKNSDVTSSLNSRLAKRVTKNDSINRLRDLGFSPSVADYEQAAKVSTATNRFIDDAVRRSGAQLVDNDLPTQLATKPQGVVIDSPAYERTLQTQLSELQNRLQTGELPNQFSVADALAESRKFSGLANTHNRQARDVAGNITNSNHDALGQIYSKVSRDLRNFADRGVEGLSDAYTRDNLRATLQNAGANQKTIDYMMDNNNLRDMIRATSLFEDARNMAQDMSETPTRRNAVSGSTNPVTQIVNASGIPQAASTLLRPIGNVTGRILDTGGNILQNVGNRVGSGQSNPNVVNSTTVGDIPLSQQLTGVSNRNISANMGNQVQDYMQAQNAPADMAQMSATQPQMMGAAGGGANMGLTSPLPQSIQPTQGGFGGLSSEQIAGAMIAALNDNNVQAFNVFRTLYDLTLEREKMLMQASAPSTKALNSTQQRANAAALALQELSGMTPDVGYDMSGIPVLGGLATLGGNAYEGAARSLAQQIGYMVSGANIAANEAENIGKAYVPQPFDSEATRQQKLQRAAMIIQQYQNTQPDQNLEALYASF